MAKEWLQVRVDIHSLILGIFVVVQAGAIVNVGVPELELNDIAVLRPLEISWQVDPVAVEANLVLSHDPLIDLYLGYFLALEIQE